MYLYLYYPFSIKYNTTAHNPTTYLLNDISVNNSIALINSTSFT